MVTFGTLRLEQSEVNAIYDRHNQENPPCIVDKAGSLSG
jgi:hypothetical protein